jgi:hypothetical protein
MNLAERQKGLPNRRRKAIQVAAALLAAAIPVTGFAGETVATLRNAPGLGDVTLTDDRCNSTMFVAYSSHYGSRVIGCWFNLDGQVLIHWRQTGHNSAHQMDQFVSSPKFRSRWLESIEWAKKPDSDPAKQARQEAQKESEDVAVYRKVGHDGFIEYRVHLQDGLVPQYGKRTACGGGMLGAVLRGQGIRYQYGCWRVEGDEVVMVFSEDDPGTVRAAILDLEGASAPASRWDTDKYRSSASLTALHPSILSAEQRRKEAARKAKREAEVQAEIQSHKDAWAAKVAEVPSVPGTKIAYVRTNATGEIGLYDSRTYPCSSKGLAYYDAVSFGGTGMGPARGCWRATDELVYVQVKAVDGSFFSHEFRQRDVTEVKAK